MKKYVLCLLVFSTALYGQTWLTDYDEAIRQAQQKNRNILLVFSGSDWCAPCMKLDKEIWQSHAFQSYAEAKLVLLRADFPRKKANKLSKEQESKNTALAEKYNPQGFFPLVIILDKDGQVLATFGYEKISPEAYIEKLKPYEPQKKLNLYHQKTMLMGSRFDFTVAAEGKSEADQYIGWAEEEIQRIEKLISEWDSHSQTAEINRKAGISPVKVDKELFDLIDRCIRISKLTDGAFDITYAVMDSIWKFDGSVTRLPDSSIISDALKKIGYDKIILNPDSQTVFLPQKGMRIGFGAIGKGYAADAAKKLLIAKDVKAGIINASGDLSTWGKQPDGKDWLVAITNPFDKTKSFGLVNLKEGAVATSGDYEKYIILNNQKYSHIINPKTGYPARGITSVSVFAPSAELADALATAVFVMGVEAGLDRIEQIPQVDCIIVDDQGNIHKTQQIKINEN